MATWPTTLPNPIYGMGVDPTDKTVRTDMEAGAARVRRRSKARNDSINATWEFTDAQMDTFRTWFAGDCNDGSEWFQLTMPDGFGGQNLLDVRFIGTFKSTIDGPDLWRVSASLEAE